MNSKPLKSALLAALMVTAMAAMANKPEWVGHGKPKKQPAPEQATQNIQIGSYFRDEQRQVVLGYYGTLQAKGRCPPGLAKKKNGCMPPGQAKKWTKGEALPASLVLYPVPNSVIVKIGVPPPGYRYVRVANDILLIAIGTMIVVDAIEDLMRQ